MKKVSEFELIDHGIEGSQYFQGCGTFGTSYNHVQTGVGDNPSEALEDVLNMIAQTHSGNVDTEDLERRIIEEEGDNPALLTNEDGTKSFPEIPSAVEVLWDANDLKKPDPSDYSSEEEYEAEVDRVEKGREEMSDVADHYYHMSIRYNIE